MKKLCAFLMSIMMVILSCNSKNNSETKKNENLSSKVNVIKETGEISSYYSVKDEVLAFDNPVSFIKKIVLYTVGDDIYGFYGFAAQGSPTECYIVGKKKGNEIIVKQYSLNDAIVSPELTLTVLPKSVITLTQDEKVTIPKDSFDFFIEQTLSIYELPNTKSKVLVSNYNLEHKGFKLIEIGKMEKNGDEYNIWYKVKNKDFEGWVFGLIRTI